MGLESVLPLPSSSSGDNCNVKLEGIRGAPYVEPQGSAASRNPPRREDSRCGYDGTTRPEPKEVHRRYHRSRSTLRRGRKAFPPTRGPLVPEDVRCLIRADNLTGFPPQFPEKLSLPRTILQSICIWFGFLSCSLTMRIMLATFSLVSLMMRALFQVTCVMVLNSERKPFSAPPVRSTRSCLSASFHVGGADVAEVDGLRHEPRPSSAPRRSFLNDSRSLIFLLFRRRTL